MKISRIIAATPLLVSSSLAQTPPDFAIRSDLPLTVHLNPSNRTIEPGLLVPKNDTIAAPILSAPSNAEASSHYVAMMIDSAVPVLHWLQADLVPMPSTHILQNHTASTSSIIGVPYIPPQPPAGSGPHDYVIMLFEQPSEWSIPAKYSNINPPAGEEDVVGFDFEGFVRDSGLAAPVGTTYFRVLNGTAAETSSAAAMATHTATASLAADAAISTTMSLGVPAESTASNPPAQQTANAAESVAGGSPLVTMVLALSLLFWCE